MNKNFYIGQLVEAIVDYPTNNEYIHKGDIGRIVWLNNCANVEWDKNVHGHSCKPKKAMDGMLTFMKSHHLMKSTFHWMDLMN